MVAVGLALGHMVAVADPEAEEVVHLYQEAVTFVIIVIKKVITQESAEKKELIDDLAKEVTRE